MKEWFKTFTCVKSLITIALTGCFIFMTVTGSISSESFMNVFFTVISFYFGSQWEKNRKETVNVETNGVHRVDSTGSDGSLLEHRDSAVSDDSPSDS